MNTSYTKFEYNNTFLYNYNIFKNNFNIGIGTSIPKHTLSINGNMSLSHNININGSLYYNNHIFNGLNLLTYNINTKTVKPLNLINQTNTTNTNKAIWTLDSNNNLKLDFHNKNDNTSIYYQSLTYPSNKNIIICNKYNLTLTHVFLYENINIKNTVTNAITNISITLNSITYTLIKTDYNNYYKLSIPIQLNKNISYKFTINNTGTVDVYINLLGKYNFNSGLLWNINISNNISNLFIKNNIGIGTTQTFNTQLYVNKSAKTTNLNAYNINSSTLIATNINVQNNITLNNITSTNLILNSLKKNISIGTTNNTVNNDFFNISNNFIVNKNNNVYLDNTVIINNINFNNNLNITFKNKPLIVINNTNNNFTQNLNNILLQNINNSHKICINNNLNLSNQLLTNNNILNIDGNVSITNNLNVKNIYIKTNNNNIIAPTILKTINFKNTTNLLSKYIYSNNTTVKNIKTTYINVPILNNTINKGEICYDNINDVYVGNNGSNITFLSENKLKTSQLYFDYNFYGKTDLLYTNNKEIITNNINVNNKFILPKVGIYTATNFNKNLIGNLRFNVKTLYSEIHNGYSWCSIKYNNTESQLNYLSFNELTSLLPSFHNRIFNYQYTSRIKPDFITLSINPYSILNVLFKINNTIVNTTTIENNSHTHISKNIITNKLDDFNTLVIDSKKKYSTNNINYKCTFSFASDVLIDFINNYDFFDIKLISNSLNTFKIVSLFIPTTQNYNIFNLNKNSLQLTSGNTLLENKIRLFENDLNNITYNGTHLIKKENNVKYVIFYENNQFIKAVFSLFFSTPIANTNNNLNYELTEFKEILDFEATELFENDLTNTNYNNPNYDVYYNENDDQFYMENLANTHKFKIVGHEDSVVVAREYITCKIKQFNT